jgi:hypothetical protein
MALDGGPDTRWKPMAGEAARAPCRHDDNRSGEFVWHRRHAMQVSAIKRPYAVTIGRRSPPGSLLSGRLALGRLAGRDTGRDVHPPRARCDGGYKPLIRPELDSQVSSTGGGVEVEVLH